MIPHMALEQKDVEAIERVVYRNADDIAVAISRSFERLEERLESVESRVLGGLGSIGDRILDLEHDLEKSPEVQD